MRQSLEGEEQLLEKEQPLAEETLVTKEQLLAEETPKEHFPEARGWEQEPLP